MINKVAGYEVKSVIKLPFQRPNMPLKAKFCQLLSKSSYKVAFLTKCYVISGFYCTFSDYLVKLSEINFIFCT